MSDSGSHGSYRPFCVLTFRFNYFLGGFQPWGYHLINVLLHCLATGLLVRVARNVLPKTKSSIGPLIAGLTFASHPIHTEAVAGVVGRADLAACNLYLMSFLLYIAHIKYRDYSCAKNHCTLIIDKTDEPPRQLSKFKYHKIVTNLKTNLTNCSWPTGVRKDHHNLVTSMQKTKKYWNSRDTCCWVIFLKEWGSLIMCILFAVAAMLSKETGVTVLGVCILYDVLYSTTTNKVSETVLYTN